MTFVVVSFILVAAALLQNSIVNQISMLYGSADLVLMVLIGWMLQSEEKQYWGWGALAGLLIGISSALPTWLPILEYLIVVGIITFLQRRVWQVPIWLLLSSTILATMLLYGFELIYLAGAGVPFELSTVFNLLLLPSIVLNLILSFPIYGLMGEVSKLLNPEKVDV